MTAAVTADALGGASTSPARRPVTPAVPQPQALLALVSAVGLLGAVVLLVGLWGTVTGHHAVGPFLLLVIATTLLTDVTAIDLRVGRHAESFTWSELSIVLGLALLPVDHLLLTTVALAAAYLVTGQPLVKWVLNVGSYAAGLGLAALVCRAITTPSAERPVLSAVALLAGVTAWAVWNKLTINAAIALAQGRRLRAVLRSELPSTVVVFTCNVGLALATLALARSHAALVLAAPGLVVLAGLLNRWYLHLVQDRAAWRALETASRELTPLDEDVLVAVALSRVTALMQADGAELRPAAGAPGHVHRLSHGEVTVTAAQALPDAHVTVSVTRTDGSAGLPVERTDASVALGAADQQLGTLVVQYDGAVRLTRRERSQLTAYAGAFAVGLCNARLHAQVRTQAERSAHAALHDSLTGLPNRAMLRSAVERALAERPGFGLLLLDLDRFKPVNDAHGHEAGDEVLRVTGERLRRALRPADVVARLGGDEFAVFLDDSTDVRALTERLQARVAAPIHLGDAVVAVGVSVGHALHPVDGTSFEALLRAADQDMYRSKRSRTQDSRSLPAGAVPAQQVPAPLRLLGGQQRS